jgi:predicted transcriptional regulator
MTTLQIRIETAEDFDAALRSSMKAADAGAPVTRGHSLSFNSYEDLYRVLAPSRLAIVKALAGQGPLSIREVARRVGRDVQAVHRDVTTLINSGVIDRNETGVSFPYDEIDFQFKVTAAA